MLSFDLLSPVYSCSTNTEDCVKEDSLPRAPWDFSCFNKTWDPSLQCCNGCTWTHLSSSNGIQRNRMGLKITACMCSWGGFWTPKIQRDQKPQLPFLRSLEQNQDVKSKSRILYMPPLHTPPPRGGQNA